MTPISFDAGSITATLDLTRTPFQNGLKASRAEAKKFEKQPIKLPLKLDPAGLRAEMQKARAQIGRQAAVNIPVGVTLTKARADLGAFRRQAAAGPSVKLPVEANLAKARQQMRAFRQEVAGGPAARLQVHANTAQAKRDVAALRQVVGATKASIKVAANTTQARAQVAALKRQAGGTSVHNVAVNTGRSVGMLAAVTAGLAAISAGVGPAVAALAAVPFAAGVAAQAIAALGMGFSGVGDAMSALEAREKQAATTSVNASGSRQAAIAQVQSATQSLQDAQRQAARTAVQGDEQMRQARAAYSDAVRQANRQVEQAEDTLSDAQRDARRAQQELNQAREQARIRLRNYRLELSGAALDEEDAVLGLRRAEQQLAALRAQQASSPGSVAPLDMAEADLAVRQARQSLAEIRQSNADLRREAGAASRAGVEGDSAVVAARRQVADANRAVLDAERALREARLDGARDVAEANRQLLVTQREVGQANADAARAITRAQQQVSQAMRQSGAAAAGAGAQMFDGFAKASPAAQRFARFLKGEFLPNIRQIKTATQATMLPRMETALRRLTQLTPTLTMGFAETGRVLGELAKAGSRMMTSGPWKRDTAALMASSNRVIGDMGGAGLQLADAFRSISVAAAPMVERFSRWAEKAAAGFNQMIQGRRASGELAAWFQTMGDRLAFLGSVFGRVVGAAWNFAQAMAPMGGVLLGLVGHLADFVSWLSQTHPWLLNLLATGTILFGALAKLGSVFTTLGGKAALAGGALSKLWTVLKFLSPAFAATKIMSFASGLTVTGAAASTTAGKFRNMSSTVIGGMSGILGKLPLIGAAVAGAAAGWDAITTSAAEAKTAMAQGGQAATDAARDLSFQSHMTQQASNTNRVFGGIVDALTTDWQEYRSTLSGVQGAQADVGRGQWILQQAITQFGPKSGEARLAAEQLRGKMHELTVQERMAKDGVDRHTAAMRIRRDEMLAFQDGKIAYQQALLDVNNAVAQNGRTLSWNTQQGLNNRRALQTLATQGLQNIQTMRSQNVAQWKVSRAEGQLRQDFINSAVKMGASREEARRYANRLGLIPERVPTRAELNKQEAERRRREFQKNLNKIPKVVPVEIQVTTKMKQSRAAKVAGVGGGFLTPIAIDLGGWIAKQFRAAGGPVVGQGGPTADRVPVMASNGEYVVNAAAYKQHRALVEAINTGSLQHLQGGGPVRKAPAARAAAPLSAPVQGGDGATAPVVPGVNTAAAAAGVAGLAGQIQALTDDALTPLAQQITTVTNPALLAAQTQAGIGTTLAMTRLTAKFPILSKAVTTNGLRLRTTWQQNTANAVATTNRQAAAHNTLATRIQATTGRIRGQMSQTQRHNNVTWTGITARTGAAVRQMTGPQFGQLQNGMGRVRSAMTATANWAGVQFGRMYRAAAGPARRTITGPMNAMVRAWNRLASDFAMRPRRVAPLVPGFASGGQVPGQGNRDTVPAMLTPREVVWDRRAVDNAGGPAAVDRMRLGYRSGAYNAAANPARDRVTGQDRLRAMRKTPLDDLPGAFAYGGVQPHVAAAGRAVERMFGPMPGGIGGVGSRPNASDHPTGHALDFMTMSNRALGDKVAGFLQSRAAQLKVKYLIWKQMINQGSGWDRMEDRGSITANHFDHVHASFLRAGEMGRAFSGANPFDPAAIVNPAFAGVVRQINQIARDYPGNRMAETAVAVARKALAGIKGYAINQLGAMTGAGLGKGDPRIRRIVQMVAAQRGWGSGPQWAALDWIISRESGWDPWIKNPNSSAAGLFQKMVSVHGPLERTIRGQAEWGTNYIAGRYGSPLGAKAYWLAHGNYDNGGALPPGLTLAYNGTGRTEHVVTGDTWDAIRAGGGDRRLSQADIRALAAELKRTGTAAPSIGQLAVTLPPGATVRDFAETVTFQLRHAGKGVHG